MNSTFTTAWAFIRFSEAIRTKYRYSQSPETSNFLQALVATANSRIKILPREFSLWRAQLGCHVKVEGHEWPDLAMDVEQCIPFCVERMKPLANAAHEGRANPKGIPCLYAATERETALSEQRPWMGSRISLAHLRTTRDLKLVDCSLFHAGALSQDLLLGKPSLETVRNGIWAQVDMAFSEPVTAEPTVAEYAPTQAIAEAFRLGGFDGIAYRSKVGEGLNVAVFDLDSAEILDRSLFRTETVAFSFKEEARPRDQNGA